MIYKLSKALLLLLLFLCTGEFLINLDIKYNLTYIDNYQPEGSNFKILDASNIQNKNFKLDENQNRIMIIGDSYIEGIGISKPLRFKNQLNDFLIKNTNLNKKHIILSLSRPGNNAIDKYPCIISLKTI